MNQFIQAQKIERSEAIDYCKGWLIFLVVVGHAIQFLIYSGPDFWDDPLFKGIYMFHMPLFIGISGYLAYAGINTRSLGKYMVEKIPSYVIPIISFSAIYRTAWFLIGGEGQSYSVIRLPLVILKESAFSLWFLWVLLGCIVLTSLLRACAGRFFFPSYLVSSGAVLFLPEKASIEFLKFLYPFFQIGYAVAAFGIAGCARTRAGKFTFGFCCVIAVVCYLIWNQGSYIYLSKMRLACDNIGNILVRFSGGFSASVVVLMIMIRSMTLVGMSFAAALQKVGQFSLPIYILQSYIFTVVGYWVSPVLQIKSVGFGAVLALLAGVIVTFICFAVGRFILRCPTAAWLVFGMKPKGRLPRMV